MAPHDETRGSAPTESASTHAAGPWAVPDPAQPHPPILGGERPFLPGDVFAGRYRIVALLGQGGMGTVYRADDLKLGQPVALKFLTPRTSRGEPPVERFVAEVRLARRVSHPNVARVFDLGEDDGCHYLSMEYIDGENLASLLRRIGRLPADTALAISRQLCLGLAAAHDKGVLHRDLKPANIMIDGRGRPRITDFGLAVAVGTESGTEIAGTRGYMAPEQLTGGTVTEQTDLYALGLVLYELWTGSPVFPREDAAARRRARIETPAIDLSVHVRDVDPAVERVIQQCVEADPRKRPGSALSMAAALPGGDLLSATIAAGKTPSPGMVAAAGEKGALRPSRAWAYLISLMAGMIIAAWQVDKITVFRQAHDGKPPDVLVERARDIIKRFGYTEVPRDVAHWFTPYRTYLRQAAQRELWIDRWDARRDSPLGVQFVYRQSPGVLLASNTSGVVLFRDPPADIEGMTDVSLDPSGRLVRLLVVTAATDLSSPSATRFDWADVFAEAGLEIGRFHPSTLTWMPPIPYRTAIAWHGVHPDEPNIPLNVVGAVSNGRPVYFDVFAPAPGTGVNPAGATTVTGVPTFLVVLVVAILIACGIVARQNLRLGRGDRSGAIRIGVYFMIVATVQWALQAHHVPSFQGEYLLLIRVLGSSLFWGSVVALFYVAVEPAVRRRWPHVLISWTRLLAGRAQDPLVGQAILIGALGGIAIVGLRCAEFALTQWTQGQPVPPLAHSLMSLGTPRQAASVVFYLQNDALSWGLGGLFMLLFLRNILRSQVLAVAAWIAIVGFMQIRSFDHLLVSALFGTLVGLLSALFLLRFGLLSFLVLIFVARAFTRLPITLDASAWYSGRSFVMLAVLAAFFTFAFRSALGGRPVLGNVPIAR